MKKSSINLIILAISAIFLIGCSTKHNHIYSSNIDIIDMKDSLEKRHKIIEPVIHISDQELEIEDTKFGMDDFHRTNDLPRHMITESITLSDEISILLKYKVGYLGQGDNIVLLSYDEKLGHVCFDIYDYTAQYNKEYKFKNYCNASNFKMISANVSSFYLIYDKDDIKIIDTFSFDRSGISFLKRQKFKNDVVNIYQDVNTIFIEYVKGNQRYIAICNSFLAVLDVVQVDDKIEIEGFRYDVEKNECHLKLYAKISGEMYYTEVPITNNYSKLYSYTILKDQDSTYKEVNEHHYIISDKNSIFINGSKIEQKELIGGNNHINKNSSTYLLLENGDILKSNYNVCYALEKPYNNVDRFVQINNDYYVGVDDNNIICYIDKEYQDRIINSNLIGEEMGFERIFIDHKNKSAFYIDKEDRGLYTLKSHGRKELESIIPNNIWKEIKDAFEVVLKIEGILYVEVDGVKYWYSPREKKWLLD